MVDYQILLLILYKVVASLGEFSRSTDCYFAGDRRKFLRPLVPGFRETLRC